MRIVYLENWKRNDGWNVRYLKSKNFQMSTTYWIKSVGRKNNQNHKIRIRTRMQVVLTSDTSTIPQYKSRVYLWRFASSVFDSMEETPPFWNATVATETTVTLYYRYSFWCSDIQFYSSFKIFMHIFWFLLLLFSSFYETLWSHLNAPSG